LGRCASGVRVSVRRVMGGFDRQLGWWGFGPQAISFSPGAGCLVRVRMWTCPIATSSILLQTQCSPGLCSSGLPRTRTEPHVHGGAAVVPMPAAAAVLLRRKAGCKLSLSRRVVPRDKTIAQGGEALGRRSVCNGYGLSRVQIPRVCTHDKQAIPKPIRRPPLARMASRRAVR
jgi:hypothetical protein